MLPILYDKTGRNQIGVLVDTIECFVTEERNGNFELNMIYPSSSDILNDLINGNIIVADANDISKNQKFRIYNTRKMMSNRIEICARHISFDLANDFIESLSIEEQSCEYALNMIFRNSQFSQHYRGYSDISMVGDFKHSKQNCLNAIVGVEGSIIDTFGNGAEILRDNTDIYVYKARGKDNGVTIEYRKNLTGLTVEEYTNDLVTRIRPYAKYKSGDDEVEVLGDFVDSPYISNYSHPYVAYIDYSDKFDEERLPTVDALIELALKEYSVNKVDIIKSNYKIEFIPLSKCVGYEGLEDEIDLCDIVYIKDTRYNIDTQAKVIKVVFNVLKGRYDSMELGDPKTKLGDVITTGALKGPKGDKGEKGDPGQNGSIGNFPDTLPETPIITYHVYGFSTIELSWTFENEVFYSYELYGSKIEDFIPNTFNLLFSGQASAFLHQVNPEETWYYRVCGMNTYGNRTVFSEQVSVSTTKIGDLSNYVEELGIKEALIGTLSLDRGWVGQLRGYWIDARELSVTDGNGVRTLDIDSFGNVNLNVASLEIQSDSVVTNNNLQNTLNNYPTISYMDSSIEQNANEIALTVTQQELQKIEVGTNNLISNSSFEYDMKYWNVHDPENAFSVPNGYDGGKCLQINGALNRNRSVTFTCSGVIPDTEYILTGYIRTMDITPGTTNFLLGFLISFYKNGSWVREIRLTEPSLETHWFRKRVLSFRTLKSDEYDTMEISCFARDFVGLVWFDHLKLTRGNKESDWSPAPSELSDRITDTEASIRINADNIALKASRTDVQNLTNRVTTAESTIQVNTDNIALKANKTDVQNLTTRVTTAENKITDTAITNVVKNNFYTKDQVNESFASQTQLEQTANNLTLTIAQSNGYNELLNGSFDTGDFSNWTVTASDAGVNQHAATLRYRARVKCVSGVNRGFSQVVRLQSGEWYTVSTNVVVDSGLVAGVEVSYNGKYFGARTNNSSYFKNGVLQYTFQADENTNASVLFYADGKSYGDLGNGKNAYFYYVQLEKGQVATAFSPHPNEIYTTNAVFDKNGLRVNQTNVNTYTQMSADGFFVNMSDGNALFEASDKIALYDGRGTSCMTVVNDPDASYGNARIDLRGGINFIHNPNMNVGKNQILLGNDDRADLYGYHNLSIRAHNSLGFMDNNGLTHMYFATRTGSIIMKGTVYQNSQSGISTFSLLRSREVINDYGYTTEDMVNSILTLETSVNVDENEDYSMRICSSENELVTKILGDSLHIDQGSIIAGLVETVKYLKNEIEELKEEVEVAKTLRSELDELRREINEIKNEIKK